MIDQIIKTLNEIFLKTRLNKNDPYLLPHLLTGAVRGKKC